MGLGLVRIALECEKAHNERVRLADEPIWSMYCNGRKVGYAVRREPTEDDLRVMQMLRAASMGAGVLPVAREGPEEGEMTYMRAHFERVVGSKDSETYYMMSPDGNGGPELSIFFVRTTEDSIYLKDEAILAPALNVVELINEYMTSFNLSGGHT
ncbi:hypothetical protein STAS_23326 [Striga asiatica]|uniref:Uncharacterized protein n=1 Tax=Striga asiatica TaxID=4170 RepID=A0A5A7QN15_STRAF|nr:hypothetical protein STAS_23326 [Striga asiatica]